MKRPKIAGIELDAQTRCIHYRTSLDIVAIKMRCCQTYYACKDCHEALADHPIEVWPQSEWDASAVTCGACGIEMSIRAYLQSAYRCPRCDAPFNPGCRSHQHAYFEGDA